VRPSLFYVSRESTAVRQDCLATGRRRTHGVKQEMSGTFRSVCQFVMKGYGRITWSVVRRKDSLRDARSRRGTTHVRKVGIRQNGLEVRGVVRIGKPAQKNRTRHQTCSKDVGAINDGRERG